MRILLVVKTKFMESLGPMYLKSVIQHNCHHECLITDLPNAVKTAEAYQPHIVGYSIMTGDREKFRAIDMAIKELSIRIRQPIITMVGGPDPTFFPDGYGWADMIIPGEAEQALADLLHTGQTYGDLDSIPWPARDDYPGMKVRDFIASRGCTYGKCLAGDTIVHTIGGDFPIRDLVGKDGVKVLSRDPVTQFPKYVSAINIRKTQKNASLVRVLFDDGSYIDCTPDHKFMVFKAKNQYIQESEWEVEAQDLKPKQSVRAFNASANKDGRVTLSTRRSVRKYRADAVMESILERPMEAHERVHHKDKNPANDFPDNLILTTKNNHTRDHHPDVFQRVRTQKERSASSERMKKNNPVHRIPRKILSERAKRIFGGRRQSLEERLKRRNLQLGENNSNYKGGFAAKKQKKQSRVLPEINHKILSVEKLSRKEDVYCMEIPGIHWFYANKVLVHNCGYCYNSTWERLYPDLPKLRVRSARDVVNEIASTKPEFVYFQDSTFGLSHEWLREFARLYRQDVGAPYHVHLRPNQVTDERASLLSGSGCVSMKMALETASDRLRKLINRGNSTNEHALAASEVLRKHKIACILQNILGLPSATIEDDLYTLEINIRCRPAYAWSSIFQPYPMTELAQICEREGYYTGDYSEISDNFFDNSVLNFTDEHKEQIVCLQRVFAFCVETQTMPEVKDLNYNNLPKFIHDTMRKVGDRRMFRYV